MDDRSSVPGTCGDCGSDAYIRLAGENGSPEMVCAHCFVDRARTGTLIDVKRPSIRTDAPTERLP